MSSAISIIRAGVLGLAVVGALMFGAVQVQASGSIYCSFSAGGCYDNGCQLHCGSPRSQCVTVHGTETEQCDCQCIYPD